jgi:ATP-dependent DNA helicase RecG
MAKDEWIDKDLSSELPILRDGGEGQRVEFKREYPKNVQDLAKEIAAFASSNSGRIIIGIADDGELVGFKKLKTLKERDDTCRRIEGLCTNNVKPAITPTIKFAKEDGKVVLVIEVPKGQQPIYYSGNKPYIRHLSQSRPAEPHEVIERIIEWSKSSPLAPSGDGSPEDAARSQFLSTLAGTLFEVIIFGDELDGRNVNPWLEELRFQLGSAGRTLRELAAEDVALEMNLDERLRELADSLDKTESHRLVMGGDSWSELEQYIADAVQNARELKGEHIDTVSLSEDSISQLQDLVRTNARQLDDLDQRAEQMASSANMEEVQNQASEIGYTLLRVSYYWHDDKPKGFAEKVRVIGKELHLLETERLYMDGGQSMQKILDKLHEINTRLQLLVTNLELY